MDRTGLVPSELIAAIVKMSIVMTFGYFALKFTIDAIDPTKKQKKEAQEKVNPGLFRVEMSTNLLFQLIIFRRQNYLEGWAFLTSQ